MSKDRGFKKLVGKTIKKVNTKTINEVLIVDDGGNFYVIKADAGPLGIPVITLVKREPVMYELPEKSSRLRGKKVEPFPYPPEKDNTLD